MVQSQPKIAVVLGGGGIKPYSAIPLIRFLEKHEIPVEILVGCSGGSIMVSLWASGYSPDRMLKEVAPRVNKSTFKPNWRAAMGVAGLPYGNLGKTSALVHAGPIRKLFHEIWGETRLEDLPVKTILQVTDFTTGEGFGLESGLLADCVYASSAIYPLLPAIQINDRWLYDGGFTAPVPILQAVKHNADIIIAVDFLEKFNQDPKGIFDNLMHTGKQSAKALSASQVALTLNLHHAEIIYMKVEFEKFISFWEIEKFPEIMEAGEKALSKVSGEILDLYRIKSGSGPFFE
jgi:NTE family protein